MKTMPIYEACPELKRHAGRFGAMVCGTGDRREAVRRLRRSVAMERRLGGLDDPPAR